MEEQPRAKRTKAERRAEASKLTKRERRTKAAADKGPAVSEQAPEPAPNASGHGDSIELEARLARIEKAVAAQARSSDALLAKLDELLDESGRSVPSR